MSLQHTAADSQNSEDAEFQQARTSTGEEESTVTNMSESDVEESGEDDSETKLKLIVSYLPLTALQCYSNEKLRLNCTLVTSTCLRWQRLDKCCCRSLDCI